MKKLLGTLQVWLDMDETRIPSGIQRVSEEEWDLIMRPTKDHSLLTETQTRAGFQTVMAHEMGHFIAQITRDPVADKRNWTFANLPDGSYTPSPLSVLGEEKLAWKLARVINPDLDSTIEQYALRGYQQGAEDEAFETGQLDRLQSFVFHLPEPSADSFDSDRWEDDGGALAALDRLNNDLAEDYRETSDPNLVMLDFYETRAYSTSADMAFYRANSAPLRMSAMSSDEPSEPTGEHFQRFICEWAAKMPCRANTFPIEPKSPKQSTDVPTPPSDRAKSLTLVQSILGALFVACLLSAVSTIVGYALLGAIEVSR